MYAVQFHPEVSHTAHALSSLGVGELVLSAREWTGLSHRTLAADFLPLRAPSPFDGPPDR